MKKVRRLFRDERGVTLIELMIVVAIIALLSIMIIAQFGRSRAAAADGRALDYIDQLRRIMALYYAQNGVYPAGGGINNGAANAGGTAYTALIKLLSTVEQGLPDDAAAANLIDTTFEYYPNNNTGNTFAPSTFTLVVKALNGTGSLLCADPTRAVNLGSASNAANPGVSCQ